MWSLGIAVLPGASLLFEDARARCEHLSQRAVSALARSLLAAFASVLRHILAGWTMFAVPDGPREANFWEPFLCRVPPWPDGAAICDTMCALLLVRGRAQ